LKITARGPRVAANPVKSGDRPKASDATGPAANSNGVLDCMAIKT